MSQTVYEGSAELNIQPFLDALNKLDQETGGKLASVAAQFQQLDASVGTALRSIRTQLSGIAKDITTLGAALAKANGQLATTGQQLQQAARGTSGPTTTNGAAEQAIKAGYAREIDLIRKANAEKAALQQQGIQNILTQLRYQSNESLQIQTRQFAQERAALQKELAVKQQMEAQARQEQINASLQLAQALSNGDRPGADKARTAYRDAVQGMRVAVEEQKGLQKQLTQVVAAEAQAQTALVQRELQAQVKARQSAYQQAALAGKHGLGAQWEAVQTQLKQVEDRFNSIYRAGAQLTSLGSQFVRFAQDIGQVGMALSKGAGDFDFWIARTRAAMQAAGSEEAVSNVTLLRERTLELGESIGSLDPAQLAEGWYTYQAAIGTTIQTTEDLNVAQQALGTMLKAGVISASDPATVMRGVSGVLSAYRENTDQAAYATSVLMNVTQRTQAEFGDLLEAFKMVGSGAAVMNANIAETSTLFSLMAQQNIKGSQAGRALNMVYSRLLDPTSEANDVLQEILVTSQGLTGSWKDVAYAGGSFIGLLGQIDAKGKVVKEGFLDKFVQPFLALPKAMRDTALGEAIGKVFPENAARGLLPVVTQYADALNKVKQSGGEAGNEILQLYAHFRDGGEQAKLFDAQWKTVSESVKVRMDKATYGIREALIRIGLVVAEAFIPAIEVVSRLIQRFADFAEQNPKLTSTILAVVGGIALLAGAVGPLLIVLGTVLSSSTGLAVAFTAIQGAAGLAMTALGTIAPVALAVGAAIFGLVVLVRSTASQFSGAWQQMGQAAEEAWAVIQNVGASLGDLFGGLFEMVAGLIAGNGEQIREGLQQTAVAIIEIFLSIPQRVLEIFSDFAQQLYDAADGSFSGLAGNMETWGNNLMVSLANGIVGAAGYVYDAVSGIAEGIAQFFRSFSPPRYGPLRGIYIWGRNLISTFIDGMNTADIDAVSDVAGRIGDALKLNKDFGEGVFSSADLQDALLQANELAAQMVGIVQDGGRVSADFFATLKTGLGEWYDDVVGILMAYQEVYAAQQALDAEKKRLDLLKEQRKELERQNKTRQDAFDAELKGSYGGSYQNNQQYIVDPNSAEGKAKIEQMRQSLSTEDFQNWINFQKKLWDEKTKAEDNALAAQESAAQAAVDNYTKQLEIVKAQYDYLVKMYEYAKGLLNSAKGAEGASAGGGGGGGAPRPSTQGTPADLEAARKAIRDLVGADQAIYDEKTLTAQRGGDQIGALEGAAGQKKRELERIDALEAENRRRRAKYETDLINATSDEEKARIKQQQDAWDAAYKEEKARLQERKSLTQDITEAADQQAALGESQRIQEERAAAEKQISGQMQGQLEATGSLKEEEKDLQDLRNIGDRKRLEFQERLNRAKGDEAETRKIKEEQKAWEEAYKAALQAQEERVQALREADQATKAKAAGGGYAVPGGGGIGVPQPTRPDAQQPAGGTQPGGTRPGGQYSPDLVARKDAQVEAAAGAAQGSGRDTKDDAIGKFQRLIGVLKLLGDTSIDTRTKFSLVGQGIGALLAPVATLFGPLDGLKGYLSQVASGAQDMVSRFQNTGAIQNLGGALQQLWGALAGGKGWFAAIIEAAGRLVGGLFTNQKSVEALSGIWTNTLKPALDLIINIFSTGVLPLLGEVGGFLTNVLAIAVSLVAGVFREVLVPAVRTVFDFFATVLGPIFRWLVDFLNGALSIAVTAMAAVWETKLKPALEVVYAFLNDILVPLLNLLKEVVLLGLQLAVAGVTKAWELLKPAVQAITDFIDSTVVPIFKNLYENIIEALKSGISSASEKFDGFKAAVERVTGPVRDFINKVSEAISKFREFLSMGGGSGGNTEVPGHADGLYAVPYDNYLARLHAGERVLTAKEAAAYNQLEAGGLLKSLETFMARASSAVSSAQTSLTQRVNGAAQAINTDNSVSKVTNINIGTVEATNPTSGKAFLSQLAFIG